MNADLGGKHSGALIGAALAVHREFGPGLDEADYESALCLELTARGIEHQRQVPLPLIYKGVRLDAGYRLDVVVGGNLLAELKALEVMHPVFEAQLLTHLRISQIPLGLLINFNVLMLRQGIVRRANTNPRPPVAPPATPSAVSKDDESGFDNLSREVIAAAIEVHRHLGGAAAQRLRNLLVPRTPAPRPAFCPQPDGGGSVSQHNHSQRERNSPLG